jgi:hypothetical protein
VAKHSKVSVNVGILIYHDATANNPSMRFQRTGLFLPDPNTNIARYPVALQQPP